MSLTDNDYKFGPFTWGRTQSKYVQICIMSNDSYYNEDGRINNCIRLWLFGWVISISIPNIIKRPCINYGICIDTTSLCIHYGLQTWDSSTNKKWYYFFPWTLWRFKRHTIYNPDNTIHYQYTDIEETQKIKDILSMLDARENIETVNFHVQDYDGENIEVNTFIEEREYAYGVGNFKWLSWFIKNKINRSLSISFKKEIGKDKGTWKGGVLGHGIDMLQNETHKDAMIRYCQQEHRAKLGVYKIKLL